MANSGATLQGTTHRTSVSRIWEAINDLYFLQRRSQLSLELTF